MIQHCIIWQYPRTEVPCANNQSCSSLCADNQSCSSTCATGCSITSRWHVVLPIVGDILYYLILLQYFFPLLNGLSTCLLILQNILSNAASCLNTIRINTVSHSLRPAATATLWWRETRVIRSQEDKMSSGACRLLPKMVECNLNFQFTLAPKYQNPSSISRLVFLVNRLPCTTPKPGKHVQEVHKGLSIWLISI